MRRTNSVGGYRVYPGSPAQSDIAERDNNFIGIFQDGMDRLNQSRTLTQREMQIIERLDPNSQIAIDYLNLKRRTNALWELALNNQREVDTFTHQEIYSLGHLGEGLINCANSWINFKNRLENFQ